MDVFNRTYVKNTSVHKLKKPSKNHHVYEDKCDSRRKMVIVRGTLIFMKLYNQDNFSQILVNVIILL